VQEGRFQDLASDSLSRFTENDQVPFPSEEGEFMLEAPPAGSPQLRVVRRQSIRPPIRVVIRPSRPSLLEGRLAGDPWVVHQSGENLALCFSDWPLATVRGLPLDVPSLNRILERLRTRPPRRR
jgi:hypothetical protein